MNSITYVIVESLYYKIYCNIPKLLSPLFPQQHVFNLNVKLIPTMVINPNDLLRTSVNRKSI